MVTKSAKQVDKSKIYALWMLFILALITLLGSYYLSVKDKKTPEFIGVAFASITTFIAAPIAYRTGKEAGREETLNELGK